MSWTNGAVAPIAVPLTTETDPETGEVTVTAWSPKFHAHLPTWPQTPDEFFAERPALEPFRVMPERLVHIFAGDTQEGQTMTAALRFEDEAEGRAAMAAWWAEDVE